MEHTYITPALRTKDVCLEKMFLASGNGENTKPVPGGWDYDWDETNN